jgi:diamine N-acetyltransferase
MFTAVQTKKQIETVARLARDIWTDHYVPIIGKEQTDYMLEKFQSAEAVSHQIRSEDYLYFLIEPEEHPVGYLAVQPRPDDLLLSKIYLERGLRGHGIGRKAMRFVEDLAQELGKPTITLTVNRHNSNSIAAYSRWGFRITNTAKIDVGSGFVMDDYVMQK